MNYDLASDVPYIQDGHPRHHLDLYTPQNSSGPFPLIIYIHGGAFKFGDKKNDLVPLRLLSQNYALASINYRLSGDAIFPAAIQDCRAAVRFLRANFQRFNLDPVRFISMGESAGAYMALMVGIHGTIEVPDFDAGDNLDECSDVLGVIDFYGPTDFLQMDAHAPEGTTHIHNEPGSPESLFLGQQITTVPELVRRANPITYVNDQTPSVLIAHGNRDMIVPFHQSVLLAEALRERGREVVFHEVEGVDHVFWGISEVQRQELDEVVDRWLKERFGL